MVDEAVAVVVEAVEAGGRRGGRVALVFVVGGGAADVVAVDEAVAVVVDGVAAAGREALDVDGERKGMPSPRGWSTKTK
ncbi:MAG: hypothetical protein H6703_07890 [Myxococcales bacterium]|nr:hypothetical protein [Myxococcales bacterium]